MGNFYKQRKEYITVTEMNRHLAYVFKYYDVKFRAKKNSEPFNRSAFIEDKLVYFSLTYKYGSIPCTYICRKDGEDIIQAVDGAEAYRILSLYYKVPHVNPKYCGRAAEGGLSASPFLYVNPKFENQWIQAYGYDLNSAYSSAMLQPMPDTTAPMRSGTIKVGEEIGFQEVLNPKMNNKLTMLEPVYQGYSQYIFPLMESPFKQFVKNWYDNKKKAEPDSIEKIKAKGVLNYSIGYLQKYNPFLRATIIGYCNEQVKKLVTEDTLFCNTDSIVSRVPLDLPMGENLGQWKMDHEGLVAYKGANYQWENGDTSFRGIPKSWFPKGWDILRDPLPNSGNVYKFDGKKIVKVKLVEVQK